MKYYLVLLPTQEFIKDIFDVRKSIEENNLGNVDLRINALPHITIGYFENEFSTENLDKFIIDLNQLNFNKVNFKFTKFEYWQNKISGMIDSSQIDNLAKDIEIVAQKYNIVLNDEYRKQYTIVGDHMKLARELVDENSATKMFNELLNNDYLIERIALICDDCEEKDIIWQKNI